MSRFTRRIRTLIGSGSLETHRDVVRCLISFRGSSESILNNCYTDDGSKTTVHLFTLPMTSSYTPPTPELA